MMNLSEIQKIYSQVLHLSKECKKCIDCEACDKLEELLDILMDNIDKIQISNDQERVEIKEILSSIISLRKDLS